MLCEYYENDDDPHQNVHKNKEMNGIKMGKGKRKREREKKNIANSEYNNNNTTNEASVGPPYSHTHTHTNYKMLYILLIQLFNLLNIFKNKPFLCRPSNSLCSLSLFISNATNIKLVKLFFYDGFIVGAQVMPGHRQPTPC